jgi:uncharacterized Zn-binding protein involved in type VI secretion
MGKLIKTKIATSSEGVLFDDVNASRVGDTFPVKTTETITIANPYYTAPVNPDDPPSSQPPYLTATVNIVGDGEICSGAEAVNIDSKPAARLGDAVKCDFIVTGSITPPSDPVTNEQFSPVGYTIHVTGTGSIVDVSGESKVEDKTLARIGDGVEITIEVSIA